MAIAPLPQMMASAGLLERAVYEAQTQPEISSQAAQATAFHALKQEKEQVEKAQAGQEDEKISLDEGKEEGKGAHSGSRRRKKKERRPENPWSGNLLNVRI